MPAEKEAGEFIAKVQESAKYAQLDPGLVSQIAREELRNQKDWRTALKTTRTRLHRLTGAFLTPKLDYAQWIDNFMSLPPDNAEQFKETSKNMMRLHFSTKERLPFLSSFFYTCLQPLGSVTSVLDLACGLNPLAIPWMPLTGNSTYYACDVVDPLISFLGELFSFTGQTGSVFTCNLLQSVPQQKVQVAFLLKLLPILDQVDPDASGNLLDQVNAEHLLISYPSKSLGGRSKGMKQTYAQHLERISAGRNFQIRSFEFPNENAYLLSR